MTQWRKLWYPIARFGKAVKTKWKGLRAVRAFKGQFPGWQTNAVLAMILTFLVLLTNFLLTVIIGTTKAVDDKWMATLKQGDCGDVKAVGQLTSVIVNTLSTVLLASANSFMQLVASPTRTDVDRAHTYGEWCDIGIPTFRNSWRRVIRPWRTTLLLGFALSSLPLHLLWNSAFIYTPTSYTYFLIVVNEDFPNGGPVAADQVSSNNWNSTTGEMLMYPEDMHKVQTEMHDPALWQALDTQECAKTYTQSFLYDRSDVIVVTALSVDTARVNQTCPSADGHAYQSTNGSFFAINCYANITDTIDNQLCSDATTRCPTVQDLATCLEACDAHTECNVGIWIPDGYTCELKREAKNITHHIGPESHVGARIVEPPVPAQNTTIVWLSSYGHGASPYEWICPGEFAFTNLQRCREQALSQAKEGTWAIRGVVYSRQPTRCYSKKRPQRCSLQFSVIIGIIITSFNFLKLILCILSFFLLRKYTRQTKTVSDDKLLVTVGDAIASFLSKPDDNTKGICLAEKADFEKGLWDMRWVPVTAIRWRINQHRSWFRTVGLRRWTISTLLCFLGPLFATAYFISRWTFFSKSFSFRPADMVSDGLGEPNSMFLFATIPESNTASLDPDQTSVAQFYTNVIFANLPQLIFAIAYVTYNGYLTFVLAAREYSAYASPIPRPLRVSEQPQGQQISERFLSLPAKYAITVQLVSALLHYFTSQAVFLASVRIVDWDDRATKWSLSRVGYSPQGLLLLVVVGGLVAIVACAQGVRTLPTGMPLAASCSAAISAACHPSRASGVMANGTVSQKQHHLAKVNWGVELDDQRLPIVVRQDPNGDGTVEDVGHCTFTSGPVVPPEERRRYQ